MSRDSKLKFWSKGRHLVMIIASKLKARKTHDIVILQNNEKVPASQKRLLNNFDFHGQKS